MSFQSESARRWQSLREASDRVPLHLKLITAVLTLVFFALVVISAASVTLFRDYQIRHASQQAEGLFQQALAQFHSPLSPPFPGRTFAFGPYLVALRPANGQYEVPLGVTSLPAVPTDPKWLAAHSGQLASVPATTGSDNWRVITQRVSVQSIDPATGQISNQRETLIVGVDLGDINGTIGRLINIDIVVGLVILVALAGAGVAIVRSSLRPLADIERTAQKIASGDLTQRVPDRDPRTEVGRLGGALNAMLAQIEAAFHARAQSEAAARRSEERMRRFVADASHELRTPLTAIRGYAEYYRQRGGLHNGRLDNARPDNGARETGAPDSGARETGAPDNGANAEAGQAGIEVAPRPAAAPADIHPSADMPTSATFATADTPTTPVTPPAPDATTPASATPVPASLPQTASPPAATPAPGDEPVHTSEPVSGAATSSGDADRLSTVDMDRIMERVEQESARMGMLVEDMLLLARVDQQRPIERRPVDLLTLTADAVQDARMIAPDRTIELTVAAGTAFLVLGDEPRLRQVIGNLMSNALTHTPDGTPVEVRLRSTEMAAHPPVPAVMLEVADQGPGLTSEQAERAFERFYRTDQARRRRTGGTGLGLAIVSALVTAHGGTVGVSTAPGQGATFQITLPLAPEAQQPADA